MSRGLELIVVALLWACVFWAVWSLGYGLYRLAVWAVTQLRKLKSK